MNLLCAFLAGLGFGIGLMVSGMVDPSIVLAFLDVTGGWDPSLAFVMGGALSVFSPGYWLLKRHLSRPLFSKSFFIPTVTDVDRPLVLGAILFGMGWGISGVCPGPAVANISGMEIKLYGFIVAMILGMMAASRLKSSQE